MNKILGVHTYLGGMILGLRTNTTKVIGSVESWEPGINGSKAIGNDVFSFEDQVPKANITVGNPPCSRFSQLTYSIMKGNSDLYQDFTKFEQLNDVIQWGKNSGSEVIWWETGPLSWSRGSGFFKEINSHLEEHWGQCTTLVIRYDLLWSGIPQNRTRCHIIHMNTVTPPPLGFPSRHPNDFTVKDWLKSQLMGHDLVNPLVPKDDLGFSPNAWVDHMQKTMTFNGLKPSSIKAGQRHTGSVLSGRLWVDHIDNRFYDLFEYAALQSYPLEFIERLIPLGKRPADSIMLLSKSVSPTASRVIYEEIVQRWQSGEVSKWNREPHVETDGIYYMDLKPKGIIKSKWMTDEDKQNSLR